MAAGTVNTMGEALNSIYKVINEAKTVMDADLPFLVQLETQVLQKLRDPQRKMQEQGLIPPDGPGGPMAQGAPPGGGGAIPIPQGNGAPSFMPTSGAENGMRGVASGVGGGAPNADELRRLLQ